MDAVMLIELLDEHGRTRLRHRVTGAGNSCRIGRSLICDIVIDDPYAAAEHTLLTLLQDGRVLVQDLDTRNGTRIDGDRVATDLSEIIEQGEMIVGRSRFQIRTLHSSLPPERVFRRDLLRRHRTLLAALGVALCLSFAAFSQWLNAPPQLAAAILTAVLVTSFALSLWIGFWSLITHLNHGAWQVRIHMAIATSCVALFAWGWWLYRLGAYATQWRFLGLALAPFALGIYLLVLYLHLRKATNMTQNIALIFAGIATLALSGTGWLIDQQLDVRDVNRMTRGPAVYPAIARIAPSTDIADYLTDPGALKRAANRYRQKSLVDSPLPDDDDKASASSASP